MLPFAVLLLLSDEGIGHDFTRVLHDRAIKAAEGERTVLDLSLKDYPSAKFRDVTAYTLRPAAGAYASFHFCGLLNSKNSYGAFSGWERFYLGYARGGDHRLITESTADDGDRLWLERLCGGDLPESAAGESDAAYAKALTAPQGARSTKPRKRKRA